jgi:hypothetical protein
MEANHILQSLAEKYSQCRTYCDSGEVDFDDVKGNKEQLQFRTHFVRPGYFCFEWQDYGPRRGKSEGFCKLWSMNGETRTHYVHGIEEEKNVRSAIARATGCSAGSAHIVPSLLMEDLRANSKHLLQLADLELLRNEECNEIDCYVLKGSLFKAGDHLLWISTRDFALMRVYLDKSWTAEESRRDHEALIANTELMAQLTEKGIAPPKDMIHQDTRFVTQFTYSDILFDGPVTPLPDPEEALRSRN